MKGMWWLLVCAIVAGVLLRLPQLGLRPMHTDEAVHAIKFGALLESGTYRYDKHEYHGPSLNYLTLIPAWLSSAKKLVDVQESTLRCVPVCFGIGLLFLPLLLPRIGRVPLAAIMILTAVSPAMTFFSRYYIQEMLLVFFSFGLIAAVSQLADTGRMRWAVVAGACIGLMFATKETWIIACAVMMVSALAAMLLRRKGKIEIGALRFLHVLVCAVVGVVVAVIFFSSFFTNLQGLVDAVVAYETYFGRASASGAHIHPWYYYLEMWTFWQKEQGPVWSEAAILFFAIVGGIRLWARSGSMRGKGHFFERFIFWYAVTLVVVTSTIPYKTPWVMLGSLHAMILLAGFGVVAVMEWCDRFHVRRIAIVFLFACVVHLGWQAYRANFEYYESTQNPYVYAHTTNDVKLLTEKVMEAVSSSPAGFATPVQVIVPEDQYWPLPWYFRRLSNVGWWSKVTEDLSPTPILLSSPEVEADLLRRLYESPAGGSRSLYMPLLEKPVVLRPGVDIAAYVRSDLWERIKMGKQ